MGEGGSAVRARLLMKSSTEDLEDLMKKTKKKMKKMEKMKKMGKKVKRTKYMKWLAEDLEYSHFIFLLDCLCSWEHHVLLCHQLVVVVGGYEFYVSFVYS